MALTARERQLRTVTEKDWTDQVVKLYKTFGWLVVHFRSAINSHGLWMTPLQGDEGFPDVIGLKGQRMVVAELKRQHGGVLTSDQQRWLEAFRRHGAEVFVWRPGDLEQVVSVLTGRPAAVVLEGQA